MLDFVRMLSVQVASIYIVSPQPNSLSFWVKWFLDMGLDHHVSGGPEFEPHPCQI